MKLARLYEIAPIRNSLVVCSLLNYFLVIVLLFVHISLNYIDDQGGVLGMIGFFGAGPMGAVLLAIFTDKFLKNCWKTGRNGILSIGVLLHLILTAFSITVILLIIFLDL